MIKVLLESLRFFGVLVLLTPVMVAIIMIVKVWYTLGEWIWHLW